MFDRVLVANRGEIAVRVIRAAHELGIEAVAVYSTADRDALHVRLADHAVCIGPPSAAESYLQISNVVAAAETTDCDAVHPGYGFLAENAEFVRACVDNDLVFIGPTADVVEQMGDKVRAKEAMREAGVPLVPGSDGEIGPEALRRAAAAAGFPVLLKASAGGGGKGMRLVSSEDELEDAFAGASAEAEAAFGDGAIYVEKLVAPARHVEIQVLCDAAGGVLTLGERECSIQRRHQKLIEESPSSALDPETREAMESTVASACEAIGYRNAGTFEFLVGPDGAFYFIEVNCRLQVEHPVSELVTGIDIVREQIRIASGEALAVTGRASRNGHAIEIRINAEDPARGFLPAPGTVTRFVPPLGPGVRVDTAVESGTEIVPYYDSMIAKVIVSDDTRDAAIARAERALRELVIEGIPTTRELALDVLASTAFRGGDYSTSTLVELEEHAAVARGRMTRSTSRKAARRQALFLLYQWDLTGQELASLFEGEPDDFAQSLAEAVAGRAPALDLRISAASPDWPADRLGTLERNILRIGVYELEEETVPREVAINEAVVLAKRYATEDAARLVNGILARVAREEEACCDAPSTTRSPARRSCSDS